MQQLWELLDASGIWAMLLWTATLLAAWATGARALRALRIDRGLDAMERLVLAVTLGLAALGYAVLLLGAAGLLSPALGWLLVPWLLASVRTTAGVREIVSSARTREWIQPFSVLTCGFLIVYLLAALAPETGFDALNYHLGVPRLYLEAGGLVPAPHIVYSSFPFFIEMLFTWGLLLQGETLAKLFHFFFAAALTLAVFAYARRRLGGSAAAPAALALIASPLVGYLSQTAYVDLALAHFIFLSYVCFERAIERRDSQWFLLAGTFCGLACATKYSGILAPLLLAGWLARAYAKSWKSAVGPALAVAVPCVFLTLPWLVKNWLWIGNPVAPIFSDWLPNPWFGTEEYRSWLKATNNWAGFPGDWREFLLAPWRLATQSVLFVGSPGPLFFLLPIALPALLRHRELRRLGLFAAALFYLQLLTSKLLRYHVTVFPFLALLIAAPLAAPSRYPRAQSIWRTAILGLAVLQLPFVWPRWSDDRLLTVSPSAVRIFSSYEQRSAFQSQRLGSIDLIRTHQRLDRMMQPSDTLLALTPGYQAFLSHPVLMTPNSTPAVQLTRSVIDSALQRSGLSEFRLELEDPSVWKRRWRVKLRTDRLEMGPAFYRPRFFFREDGIPLEASVFRLERKEEGGFLVIECDLRAPRRIDFVQLWAEDPGSAWSVQATASKRKEEGRSELAKADSEWRSLPFGVEIRSLNGAEPAALIERMIENSASHVLIQRVPTLAFLEKLFAELEESGLLDLLFQEGDFKTYRVIQKN